MRFVDQEGKEWEFRGEYRTPQDKEHFLSSMGEVYTQGERRETLTIDAVQSRAIVHPVPKRHVFGGVVFEETGEERKPRAGEWYLEAVGGWRVEYVLFSDEGPTWDVPILRPVALGG